MPLPEGVSVILAPNPSPMTGNGTNTYLVSGGQGCVVIDPGPLIESHLVAVAEAAQELGGARALLVTHGHPDHAEGAARLRELTGAPVLAWSREGVPAADETLDDGDVATLGDRALRAIYTPGHRYDHLCFLLEDEGTLFAGDLVAGVGTVVIAPPEGDLDDYLASLRRLLAMDARDLRLIAPGHGPAREDVQELLEGYLTHREQRERQLVAALVVDERGQRISELVVRIYTDVGPDLWPIAAYSTLAGLLRLERVGLAERVLSVVSEEVVMVGESALIAHTPLALEGVVGRPDGLDARWRGAAR